MLILKSTSFHRKLKKLSSQQKSDLDVAVRRILFEPRVGKLKLGNLSDVRVLKFSMNRELWLLAYQELREQEIMLLTFGSHENFYRDLERQISEG